VNVRARALTALVARIALASFVSACGASGHAIVPPVTAAAREDWRRAEGRPPVVVIAREGDPTSAVAMAVLTEGIGADRGAEAAVATAALLESRLDPTVSVIPSGLGVRARGLASTPAEGVALAGALRTALLAPVTTAELEHARRKVAALQHHPVADPSLEAFARCTGEATSTQARLDTDGPGLETVEGWRRAAAGLGRVAIATAGSSAVGDAVAEAIAHGAPWPTAASTPSDLPATVETRVYEATGDLSAGGARVSLAATVPRAEDGVRAAEALGDANGALAARLGGLDAPAQLRDVTTTAHARGGCLAVTFELAPRDLTADAPARIATAVALARQEIASEVESAASDSATPSRLAHRAGDPRDAADVAAWWALSTPDGNARADGEPHIAVAVGLGVGRDTGPNDASATSKGTAIRSEVDRAVVAWHEPVVEARTRVEKGQGETWIALGSPCGTLAEMENDAGLGSAFAMAAADRTAAALRGTGAQAEAWAAPDGIGVVVHGPALPNESPEAHARRLADAVGRSFAAEPVDRGAVARARARLLGEGERDDARALVTLADAIAPGHPSWLAPMGPLESLGRSSDAAVAARASALRAGPLRVAVVADASASQAEAAVRAVDRWIARRPFESRACPVASTPAPPRPATYAVDARGMRTDGTEAWLAFALPSADASTHRLAEWIAASLDGADGLLARALGGGLARAWSARVVGGPHASALVVRVDAPSAALDAAVAQARALLDRVRQGSLSEPDRARAGAHLVEQGLAASLDPARRLASLWRGMAAEPPTPSLDALRAFAGTWLKDDALVIVAVRPPRPPPKPPS
jgi:hypothetical protein